MRPIEQACYWMTSAPYEPAPPLHGAERADIAVVGAGFTGLWTAVFLKDLAPEKDVVVLEQGMAGYGGSGRNAGILGETVDHSHSLAIAHFGLDEARRLAALGQQNVRDMAGFLAAHAIDCDLELTGRLYVALTEAHVQDARHNVQIAQDLGVEGVRFLSRDEIQAEIHSPLYLGGLHAGGGGILNPFKLAQGLKRLAERLGVRFHERTAVQRLGAGVLETATGRLSAGRTIVATDAYTHHLLPKLLWRFIPLYDYILVSEPLTLEQHELIGWKSRQGVTDGRTFFNYYRLTADNRVLWGTSEAVYYPRNRVDEGCDHSERHYSELRQSFARHFPRLAGVRFVYAWGGPIASTTRLTPFFGSTDGGRILYALGYTGHGVGSTRLAGKILAHLALERRTDLLDLALVRRKPLPYPPEPLRSAAVRRVTASLRRVDAGQEPDLLLRLLDRLGIGFSS
jgi:glycine/D-amino acid oxidase-like deaminating enzyme